MTAKIHRPRWNNIEGPKLTRFKEAYIGMTRNAYRPSAPGDGCGNICLSVEDLRDPARLDAEATTYTENFCIEEDTDTFNIGCSDFETNRAFVWTIEAVRCPEAGTDGRPIAHKLLRMALADIARPAW